jgi:hypothetical protein
MPNDQEWEAELVRTGRTERDKNRPRPTAPALTSVDGSARIRHPII